MVDAKLMALFFGLGALVAIAPHMTRLEALCLSATLVVLSVIMLILG